MIHTFHENLFGRNLWLIAKKKSWFSMRYYFQLKKTLCRTFGICDILWLNICEKNHLVLKNNFRIFEKKLSLDVRCLWSKPWGRFFLIFCASQKVRMLPALDFTVLGIYRFDYWDNPISYLACFWVTFVSPLESLELKSRDWKVGIALIDI